MLDQFDPSTFMCACGVESTLTCRVLGKLRGGRLISELISLSVVSECTFYAVLDSFSTRGHGKNCPVKIFEVYVEILGVLSVGRICGDRGGWKIKRR